MIIILQKTKYNKFLKEQRRREDRSSVMNSEWTSLSPESTLRMVIELYIKHTTHTHTHTAHTCQFVPTDTSGRISWSGAPILPAIRPQILFVL